MAKITATIELRKEFMVVFAEFRGCPIYIYSYKTMMSCVHMHDIYIYKYLVDFFYNFVAMQLQVGSTKFGNAARGAGCHVINY